jgi:large subunit ribosomal protein L25
MNQYEIIAEPREDVGKGASRRLRRDGKVPGIVYGSDKNVTAITVEQNDIMHQLEHEAFYSRILTLKIGKDKDKVVLKDLQRHPYKRQLLHIDLQRINENEELTMRVPLHFINEDKCIGIKQDGGVASHVITELEIRCLPKDLPEYIDVNMAEIMLGETIHLSDLKLPEGVENYALIHGGDPAQSVVTVHLPRIEIEEEEEEEEVLEEGVLVAAPEAESETEAEDNQEADDS